jgi:hypothetical protein
MHNFIATNAPLLQQVDGRQLLFYGWLVCVAILVISVVMLLLIKGRQWRYRRWVGGIDTRAAAHYHRFLTGASQQGKRHDRTQSSERGMRSPDGRQ